MVVHLVIAGVPEHHGIIEELAAVAVGKGGDAQQRRLFRHIHITGQLFICQHWRQALVIAADGDPTLLLDVIKLRPFEMRQGKIAEQLHRHKAVLQHQRFAVHVTHPP